MSASIDPANHATTLGYDAVGRLTSVKEALGNLTTFTYTGAGQLETTKDALSRVTTFTYNSRDWVTEVKDALGNVTTAAGWHFHNCDNPQLTRSWGGTLGCTRPGVHALKHRGTASTSDLASRYRDSREWRSFTQVRHAQTGPREGHGSAGECLGRATLVSTWVWHPARGLFPIPGSRSKLSPCASLIRELVALTSRNAGSAAPSLANHAS